MNEPDKRYWNPWKIANDYVKPRIVELPKLDEPPCKICKFWKPTAVFGIDHLVNDVTCCIKEDMCHDFSCFELDITMVDDK